MNDEGMGSEAEDFVDDPSGIREREMAPKKEGVSRFLILLLLVVGGAGASFYLFGQQPFVPDTPVAQLKSQEPSKIKMPARPLPVEPSEGVKEEVVSLEKVAAVIAPAAVPNFALTAGSYLYKGALTRARAQIEKMGYKVNSSQRMESHEMTRLLVGLYDKSLADKRLAAVKRLSDGAFLVAEEGKYAVYAGSYLSLDKARRWADLLYQQGLRVDERQMKVDLPRTTLRFGEFVERSEAQKVVRKLEKLEIKELQIVPFQ